MPSRPRTSVGEVPAVVWSRGRSRWFVVQANPADRGAAGPVVVDVSGLWPEPAGYVELLEQLKARVRASQLRAARAANSELLGLYWSVGRDILDRQEQVSWGSRVIDRLATDLRAEFPDQRGWSRCKLALHAGAGRGWPQDFVQHPAA